MTEYSGEQTSQAPLWRTLALLLATSLAGSAVAGPSQPHFGSHPQGTHGQHTAKYLLATELNEPALTEPEATAPSPETDAEQEPVASEEATSDVHRACPTGGREYRKSLLITAFPRREQAGANAGGLWGAEQALAERLGEHLAGGDQLFEYRLIQDSLPDDSINPSQPIRQLAREHQTQLVLSGALYDLGMAHARDALNPGLITRTRNAAVGALRLRPEWDTRQRDFVLQLQLHDGSTGQTVHTREYRLQGVWNPKRPERARFGSPAFWETGYGREIERVMAQAGEDLNEAIRCQPLMARLDRPQPGAVTLLHAGRAQGLQAGDRLPLHRVSLRNIPGEYQQYSAHRLASGAHLRVETVYAHHSEVRLESDTTLHGEHFAVTPGQETPQAETYTWRSE